MPDASNVTLSIEGAGRFRQLVARIEGKQPNVPFTVEVVAGKLIIAMPLSCVRFEQGTQGETAHPTPPKRDGGVKRIHVSLVDGLPDVQVR